MYNILESRPVSYRITIGGRRGRHPKVGTPLITVNSEEAVLLVIDHIIDWIYRYAGFDTPIVQQIGRDLDIDAFKASLPEKLPKGTVVV